MSTPNPVLSTIIIVFAVQAILLSTLVFFKKPKRQSNTFLALLIFFYALMALNIAFINVMIRFDIFHLYRYFQLELLYGMGPALYFYTKSISKPNFRFHKTDYLHFLPVIIEFVFYRTEFYRLGAEGLYQTPQHSYTVIYLAQQWLGIFSITLYTFLAFQLLIKHQQYLKQNYSNLDKRSLNWLKLPVIFYGAFWIVWEILGQLDKLVFDGNLREYYFLPSFVGLAAVSCWIAFKSYTFTLPTAKKKLKTPNPKPSFPTMKYADAIEQAMETTKPFLNPELSLHQLAELLKIPPKQLSQTINSSFGKNFYEYVNQFRVEHFIEKVKSSEQDKYTLLSLAYDCGFRSKSTFNDSFKKITGRTPTDFIKNLKKESESMHSVD